MYDPRVVKRFIEIYETVAPGLELTVPSEVLSDIKRTAQQDMLRSFAGPYDVETLATLFELGTQAATASNPGEALARIHPTVQRLMPADIMALYLYSADGDHLVAEYVSGAHQQSIQGMTIPLGQRLTGWVAANRQTIVNSDAALDLGNVTLKLDPTPVACLSTVMAQGSDLVGVLTIYSTRRQPFTPSHVPVAEVIAGGLTNLLTPRLGLQVAKPAPARNAEFPAAANRVH